MARTFNRGQLPLALSQFLGLKAGDSQFDISETVLASIQLGDITDSPYLRFAIPVGGRTAQAAVAARFSYVYVQPGLAVALQIKNVRIQNSTAGSLDYFLELLTQAQAAALANPSPSQMVDLSSSSTPTLRSSKLNIGDSASSVAGKLFDVVTVPAGSSVLVQLPDPGVILQGNDESGIPALAVVCGTANTLVGATYYGREWPLPG